ncbi:MAG: UdgX family uracil-DNA binding protein [Actinophytocola sp.]|nr:UdgX family uracil-DNA binding protein [Actinophytocola sp.]
MTATKTTAADFLPADRDIGSLRTAASSCQGCGLYQHATQTVFGDVPRDAKLVVVGEQPGDKEDTAGEPFVGPAGALLGRALTEAGIDRREAYVTNAVKHFKFVPPERGKRRIHQKPSRTEVVACRPWLVAEVEALRPDLVLCLGATAAQSVLGTSFRITRERGQLLDWDVEVAGNVTDPPAVLATTHPASVLRAKDEDRKRAYADLVDDLRAAARALR